MNMGNQRGITTFWGVSTILIEAIAVLFVFYFLYYFWIENPIPTEEIRIVRTVQRGTVVIPEHLVTTSWLTYQDVTYAFSLQYPEGYEVSEDRIDYGTTRGHVFSLTSEDTEVFWLHIFPRQAEESIAQAFERLTAIDPRVFQSFSRKVGGTDALVYRLAPGKKIQDHIFFMSGQYFFEAPLDESTAQILGTFRFIK